ncbi:MAG: ATP-binding domain-containing protein, partial [Candidatus Riflebacteria bacterium]|nr:ATP-binding domain-containing protein [Candidatus Riflebacteria bacterium]
SIRFGNWFSIAKKLIPQTSVFELIKPYRSKNIKLLEFWSRVRNMEDNIKEIIVRQNYSSNLDSSLFNRTDEDEIILCLNYDGLYGINNINRFLQESNPNTAFEWGIQHYKIGDPILFNETERFAPVIYNNMKGKINDIVIYRQDGVEVWIQFDIELEKAISKDEAEYCGVNLIKNTHEGNSIIRFYVRKNNNVDDDTEDSDSLTIVPFQISYAVSIHKAQGLEYNSVKIVITDEIEEMITHNIFYTAITRAKEKLKIYWTPEVEEKVLSSIKPMDIQKDVGLLKLYLDKK